MSDLIDTAITTTASLLSAYDLHLKFERIREHLGKRVASEVAQSDLIEWLDEAQDENDWEDASRNRYQAALSTIFRIAMTDKQLRSNPASCIPKLQENNDQVRFLTLDE